MKSSIKFTNSLAVPQVVSRVTAASIVSLAGFVQLEIRSVTGQLLPSLRNRFKLAEKSIRRAE